MQGSLISAEIASFVYTFVMRVFVSAIPYTYNPDIPCNERSKYTEHFILFMNFLNNITEYNMVGRSLVK